MTAPVSRQRPRGGALRVLDWARCGGQDRAGHVVLPVVLLELGEEVAGLAVGDGHVDRPPVNSRRVGEGSGIGKGSERKEGMERTWGGVEILCKSGASPSMAVLNANDSGDIFFGQ